MFINLDLQPVAEVECSNENTGGTYFFLSSEKCCRKLAPVHGGRGSHLLHSSKSLDFLLLPRKLGSTPGLRGGGNATRNNLDIKIYTNVNNSECWGINYKSGILPLMASTENVVLGLVLFF